MLIRVSTLKKIVREILYRGHQIRAGKPVGDPIDVDAIDTREAGELVARALEKKTGKQVDPMTINLDEIPEPAGQKKQLKRRVRFGDIPGDILEEWIREVVDRDGLDPDDEKYFRENPDLYTEAIEADDGSVVVINVEGNLDDVDIWSPGHGWSFEIPIEKAIETYDIPIVTGTNTRGRKIDGGPEIDINKLYEPFGGRSPKP